MDSKEIKVIDEMRLRLEQIASGIFKQYELYNVFLNVNMKKELENDVELKEFQNELRIEHRELTLEFLKCLWKDPKWRNEGVDVGECLSVLADFQNIQQRVFWDFADRAVRTFSTFHAFRRKNAKGCTAFRLIVLRLIGLFKDFR